MVEGTIDNRIEKIWNFTKSMLTNPYTFAFLVILIVGILLRLKYMGINGGGLWWDEVGFLQAGKILVGMSDKAFEAAKAPLFPLLVGLIFKVGLGESTIRFLLVFLPSVGVMIGAYILGKEVFGRKEVGLIAMAIVAVFSHHLFYEARVMGDMLANCLELLTVALFVCFYVNKKKPYLLFIPLVIGILAALTRYSAVLALFAIGAYLVIVERQRLFKNKSLWVGIGAGTVIVIVYGIFNFISFGHPWPALEHYILSPISGTAAIASAHGALNTSFLYAIFDWLNYGPGLLGGGTTMLYSLVPFFVIGLSTFLLMLLSIDRVVKKDENILEEDKWIVDKLRPVFVLFLWFAISAYFWIFFWHFATPRWAMGIAPAVIVLAAYGFFLIGSIIFKLLFKFVSEDEKYQRFSEVVAVAVVILLLVLTLYPVYQRTDRMITSKAGSYDYLGPTSLWLQDNVGEDEIIMFPSYIWYEYYTGRENFVTDYDIKVAAFEPRSLTHLFLEEVPYGLIPVCEYDYEVAMRDTNIDYFVWTVGQQVWTPTPDYMVKLQEEGILQGIMSFNSGTSTQPAAWIFKVNKEALNNKLNNLDYANQLYITVTMERWEAWNEYKQKMGINEKDICGYVVEANDEGEAVDEGRFYNDNPISRIQRQEEVNL